MSKEAGQFNWNACYLTSLYAAPRQNLRACLTGLSTRDVLSCFHVLLFCCHAITMLSRFFWKTPVYQNTGSTARDHLASERTFLAWIRTGLGFLALGIAIERFSQLDLRELLKPLREHQEGLQGRGPRKPDPAEIEHELEKEQSQVLVGTLMALGSGSIVYGTSRYFSNLKLLERGLFKPSYHGSALLAASVAGLAGGVYGTSLRRKWDARREREDMREPQ